ncbi:unnamed protein product [Closterium sp. NIES-65]|nr:unnamed protein product [Closterium sp. NIES-65]
MSPFPRHYLRPPFTRRTSRTLPVSPPITHFVTFSLTLKRPLVALPFSPPVTHLVAYALASKSRRTLVASHVSPPITHIIVVALSPQCPLVAHSRLSSPIALPLALKRPRGSLLHSPPITHFVAFALALSRPPVAYHLSTPIPSPSCSPLISPSNRALNLHKLPPRLCLSPSPAIALTFSPSPAIALTFSPSPAIALTFSPSPAIALTFSPSPAISLTFSPSPAIALTFSPSPAIALTFSPSPAIALTFSPSPAIALTFSPSPAIALTFSPSPAIALTFSPSPAIALTFFPSPAIALTFSPSPAIPLTFSHLRTTFALMVSPPISLVLTFSSLIAFSLAPPVPSCCPRVLPSRPVAFALAPPRFFRDLFATGVGAGLTVRHTSDMGRGVFADVDFKEGDVVLQEPPLVSMQHSHNRARALVCSHCLRFIGPLEQAVARLLTWQKGMREEEEVEKGEEDQEDAKEDKEEKEGEEGSKEESPGAAAAVEGFIEQLSSGQLKLPHAECVGTLPSAVPCPGGCTQETFCSATCATSAWADGHAMLCVGHASHAKDTEALKAFYTHADGQGSAFESTQKREPCLTCQGSAYLKSLHRSPPVCY